MNDELIMVPIPRHLLTKGLTLGGFLQKVRNGILLNEYRLVTEQDIQIYPKMGFEWVPVEPYVIVNEQGEIDDLYAFLINDRWSIGDFDSLLGVGIKRVELVKHGPEEIDVDLIKHILNIK